MKRFGWLLVLIALAVPQTAGAQTSGSPVIEVSTYGDVGNETVTRYRELLEKVIVFYIQEFGTVPVPVVKFRLYENTALFEQGLLEFGRTPERAKAQAQIFSGVAVSRDTIIIDISKKRVIENLVAHEFMHLMQYAWLDKARWPPTWMTEGQADIYAARFREWLGKTGIFAAWRRAAIVAVQARWAALQAIPSMSHLDWTTATATFGRVNGMAVTYSYAFLAYEYLEAKASRQAVTAFYRLLATDVPATEAFQRAFGMTLEAFETEVKSYLPTLFN